MHPLRNSLTRRLAMFLLPVIVMFAGACVAQIRLHDPLRPNSNQRVVLTIQDRTCGGAYFYKANAYTVTQTQNKITVQLEERDLNAIVPLCPPFGTTLQIDLGVFQPGQYSYIVYEKGSLGNRPISDEIVFNVSDARAAKAAPYVMRDYSGTWWDPKDPGWGLFVWQNAASPRDELLIAWFTYGSDGKAVWYSFSPEWSSSTATKVGPLYQSSRPPGNGSPPPGASTHTPVGTASIDFTIKIGNTSTATLTYTIGNGERVTRGIERFNP
jgi:hypothetical protein